MPAEQNRTEQNRTEQNRTEQKNNYVNKLFYGDNLDIMEDKIPDNSIDLIYLDPPPLIPTEITTAYIQQM